MTEELIGRGLPNSVCRLAILLLISQQQYRRIILRCLLSSVSLACQHHIASTTSCFRTVLTSVSRPALVCILYILRTTIPSYAFQIATRTPQRHLFWIPVYSVFLVAVISIPLQVACYNVYHSAIRLIFMEFSHL